MSVIVEVKFAGDPTTQDINIRTVVYVSDGNMAYYVSTTHWAIYYHFFLIFNNG